MPSAPVAVVKSAISKARSRLTWKALQTIQQRCCVPISSPEHSHALFAGYRLVAMDGSNFEVADEEENVSAFGYPGSRTGAAGGMGRCRTLVAQPHPRHAVHG